MRNTAIIFVFIGLIFIGSIIFGFIYLPKMADANGIDNQDIVLSMPVDSTLMRYFKDGVIPFCVNNSNGIDIQVKEGAPILAPISGIISHVYSDTSRVVIQPSSKVLVHVRGIKDLNYKEGDYIMKGDIIGYAVSEDILLILENLKNERYECPFLYMDDRAKSLLSEGLKVSTYSTENICECPSINY